MTIDSLRTRTITITSDLKVTVGSYITPVETEAAVSTIIPQVKIPPYIPLAFL